ncbi:T9SS type A sorting domain-containing protein [Flavobacterium sp. XN-5]|uniref:LamG-like jellyroll fold domain-containing protein n=1 Tax=Flavobacterium sp. XN-5 TaxID=2599390 RepID=UPI0011C7E603|nr:LamG-like jellyroll fold domain-containing protein [Flavobacterium sp. XN-5]NGY38415.1 T9SS type A sorting domain-containing protein [Flavobacterium sp. XN-5]
MEKLYLRKTDKHFIRLIIFLILLVKTNSITAQTVTAPQVNFTQRTSSATPSKVIYNIKGDFTMLGNTNLTLNNYSSTTNNEGNLMKYVDIDGDDTTLNSSMATLEVSNSGENSASQNCSKVLFAGLYWTGKSDDANESFSVTKNSITKNYNKKAISLKGPGASSYTTITAKPKGVSSEIRFPGSAQSGIFVGYQEVTDYVKTHGPGAYTVADIALTEGTNNNPGLSGGWVMIVIYENPIMKSRAVTLFDGYAYVNGQNTVSGTRVGEYGNISVSGFTTVGAGPVNMKLGVMAAEGDVRATSGSDYLAVQKLTADTNKTYNSTNYLTLYHSGNTINNFFNSSIFPVPAAGKSDPISQNNTGVDFSMFTIPNSNNSVIGNNQTATTFRFGSTYEVYTIFGFAMSVDAYIPEPQGVIVVNTIAGITPASPLTASPGDEIEYKIDIKNRGSEATKNTIITIPIPASAWYTVSSILTSNIHSSFTPANAPYYDDGTKSIIWNVGALPLLVDPNTLLASLSFKVKLTTDCATLFNSGCNSSIALNGAITGNGAISNSSFSTAISQGIDPNSACGGLIDKPILVNFNSSNSPCFTALAGPDKTPDVCGLEAVTLGATEGTSGTWSIVSGPSGGVFSNASSPNSEFSSPNTGIYTLRWTIPNGGGSCAPIIDDAQVSIGLCNKLDFDGIDDNVNFNDNFNLSNGAFSIEVWIKPNAANTNIQAILSKRNSTVLSDGYDLRLMNNTLSFNWNNGNSITSNFPISVNRWYHVAVTYDGTSYKLYIDGVSVQVAVAGSNPIANSDAKCILGAMIQSNKYPYLPTNFFTGWMQELRIWNVALTEAQTRQMMNQKIENNSSNVFGSIVPLIIPGLNWGNLQGYYPMIQSSDIINGTLIDKTNNNRNGKLIGIVTAQPETAPLPYTSSTNSAWETNSTWTYGNVWNIPNTLGVDNTTFIDWNIIKTNNNITTIGNKTVLGLLVESNTLGANNDNKIEISHYLKLDGKIDLVGRSQLVQTEGSILDTASSGSIERDQQGQSNKFNYNYWSSPVSPINTTNNNTDYTIADVMKDGTTSTPQNLKWIGGYDGSPTSPISLARYWVYKFDNYSNAYANWTRIGETGTVRVGQGYTLKGSGATSNTQNYTFVGKPNNGLISTNSISPNQLLLAGNPYPSALDSNAFIQDNLNTIDSNTSDVTNGTLYFWEHYSSNNTHVLRDYQGGYAVRNLTGGIAPSSANVDFISKAGTPSGGIPSRYIPVGQGFFVGGRPNSTTSTLIFKNSQRTFVKENDSSNVLYKMKETKKETWKNNNSDIIFEDNIKRIRLGFNSRNDYHKQLLLGFMNEKATDGIDYGYDGTSFDNLPNDIYFLTNESELIIQGVGYFNASASYPIGVKTDALGTVKFMLDGVENFDQNQNIFIYDSENDSYNDIRNNTYEVTLPAGQNKTRFSLRFTDKKLAIKEEIIDTTNIIINHSRNYNRLIINNYSLDLTVQKVVLYNSTGQIINTWKTENQSQQNIQLPIQKINSGIYIARIQTSKGDLSKKIIIP